VCRWSWTRTSFNAARRAPDPLPEWLKVKEQYLAAVLKAPLVW
jgi:hypothetical protein